MNPRFNADILSELSKATQKAGYISFVTVYKMIIMEKAEKVLVSPYKYLVSLELRNL